MLLQLQLQLQLQQQQQLLLLLVIHLIITIILIFIVCTHACLSLSLSPYLSLSLYIYIYREREREIVSRFACITCVQHNTYVICRMTRGTTAVQTSSSERIRRRKTSISRVRWGRAGFCYQQVIAVGWRARDDSVPLCCVIHRRAGRIVIGQYR